METLTNHRRALRHAGRLAFILAAAGSVAAQLPVTSSAPPEPGGPAAATPVPPPPPPSWQLQLVPLPVTFDPPPAPPAPRAERGRFLGTVKDRVTLADARIAAGPTEAAAAWLPAAAADDQQLVAQAVEVALATKPEPAPLPVEPPPLTLAAPPALRPVPAPEPKAPAAPIPPVPPATDVVQAACPSCGTGGLGAPSFDVLAGESGECVPGREGFSSGAIPKTAVGRFLYGVYHCVCYPDPCYEPHWSPLQDTAFFTPSARPVTQTRFRGNLLRGLGTPDRAEWFWPKGVGSTRGPRSPDGRRVTRLDDDQFSIYNEAATGRVGVYTEMRYRRVLPDVLPGASGFGDLTVGTKTLLHDSELFQISFQMESTIPTGNAGKGLGTGHLSLEPSLILGVKLSTDSYFQAQVAEWVPIAGDPDYAGSAMRYSFAYNHVLCRPLPDCPIIGTAELIGTTFQDGAFTEPSTGAAVSASGQSYLAVVVGSRAFICNRADLGFGSAFGIGNGAGPRHEHRIELRVRY